MKGVLHFMGKIVRGWVTGVFCLRGEKLLWNFLEVPWKHHNQLIIIYIKYIYISK